MKSRQARSLAPEDLRLCQEGTQRVAELFRKLGYQVEDSLYPLSGEELGLISSNRASLEQAYLLADQGGLQVLLFELKEFNGTRFRALAQDMLKRPGYYLLVAAPASNYSKLALINPRRFAGDHGSLKVKIHKLVIDTAHPTRHDVDTLELLAVDGRSPEELYRAQCEAFNVERATNDFYRSYAKLFRDLQKQIPAQNKGVAQFRDPTYLHAFVQRLLGRIMFLYFLQKKGWLAGDQRFLTDWYGIITRQNGNYYRDFLEPLFFETLNCRRPGDQSPWGEIPYLNGGLFEQDYEFPLYLSNDLFDPSGELSILGFFNSYNFTVEEDTPLELDVAVDPEMLGKVFENLLEEKERAKSGTFYTPRPIVHFMCRVALTEYLTDATGLPKAKIKEPFEQGEEGKPRLSVAEANRIERALQAVKILDPAVGTAAFLVGMLHEMIALRRACEQAKGVEEIKRGGAKIAEWKREFIANNLYGVDIKPEAIEIAKLRLWLSLVVDLQRDQVEPLPNLDYKLMVGDSLIDTLDGQPILEIKREKALIPTEADRALEELHRLKDRYFTVEPEERQELRGRIQEQLAQVVEAHVRERIRKLSSQRKAIECKRDTRTGKLPKRDEKRLEQLINLEGELAQVTAQVREGQFLPFLYQLYFNEVFKEKGGFDIVIANPPYGVKLSPEVRDLYFPDSSDGKQSKDSYGIFLARGLQLLKEKGYLCFITSDTWQTLKSHKPLRRLLLNNSKVLHVLAMPGWVFGATVNTSILTLKYLPSEVHQREKEENKLWACDFTRLPNRDDETLSQVLAHWDSQKISLEESKYHIVEAPDIPEDFERDIPIARYRYSQKLIASYSNIPCFIGSPKLYKLMNDTTVPFVEKEIGELKKVKAKVRQIEFNRKLIELVRFGDIAEVKHGMTTGDNRSYVYKKEGARGSYRLVDESLVLTAEEMASLSQDEKMNGFDETRFGGKYLVPYDKGEESQTEEGWLPNYRVPTRYFVDWRRSSVDKMKTLPGHRHDNPQYYFRPGITYSPTGIYSPSYRIGSVTIFDHKSSTIFCDYYLINYLLGFLCSKASLYLLKIYLSHTVETREEGVGQLPFAIPDSETLQSVKQKVQSIVEKQRKDPQYPYYRYEQLEIDRLVYELYELSDEDIAEIEAWYARRYPKLAKAQRDARR